MNTTNITNNTNENTIKTKTKIIHPQTATEIIVVPPSPSVVGDVTPANHPDFLSFWQATSNLPTNTKVAISCGIGLLLFCLFCGCVRIICRKKKRPSSLSREARAELGNPLTPPPPKTPNTILRQRNRGKYERYQQEQLDRNNN